MYILTYKINMLCC